MKTQRESSCKKIYTVRYDAVNAMLLNEFLKEHNTVQELKKEVAALTAGLQKVSAQQARTANGSQQSVSCRAQPSSFI
jgi:hypothetical protein